MVCEKQNEMVEIISHISVIKINLNRLNLPEKAWRLQDGILFFKGSKLIIIVMFISNMSNTRNSPKSCHRCVLEKWD